jgi:hypothetical protein
VAKATSTRARNKITKQDAIRILNLLSIGIAMLTELLEGKTQLPRGQ